MKIILQKSGKLTNVKVEIFTWTWSSFYKYFSTIHLQLKLIGDFCFCSFKFYTEYFT